MKRLLLIAFLLGAFFPVVNVARAIGVPGTEWHLAQAVNVRVIRAQTVGEAALFPPPKGVQRVFVEEVLKGVDTTQEFLLSEGTLKPGEEGVALSQNEMHTVSEIQVFPMDQAGRVKTGMPMETTSGFELQFEKVNEISVSLEEIKKAIAAQSPAEVGLNGEVIDALLFPAKIEALAKQDSPRATYVRFVTAIRGLERDVPALARLLESRDRTVRMAAEARLVALTGVTLPATKDETPLSLHEWSMAWAAHELPAKLPEWPPVPADFKMPVDGFPEALVKAVGDDDADAFTKAFAAWLDSGVMRDRQIEFAKKAPYPGRVEDVPLDTKIPAEQRMKSIALLAEHLHHDRFAKERAERLAAIKAQPDDSEIVRRAAFWEPPDSGEPSEGEEWPDTAALKKMAVLTDKASQQFLAAICASKISEGTSYAARSSIEQGHKDFAKALLQYVKTHPADEALPAAETLCKEGEDAVVPVMIGWIKNKKDATAQSAARTLCIEKRAAVIPIMLRWLKDDDEKIRDAAALDLCQFPRKDTALALVAAIKAEPAKKPSSATKPDGREEDSQEDTEDIWTTRQQMLTALSMTGSKQGLDTLLASMRERMDPVTRQYIVDGLGRIRDKKALPALARLAVRLEGGIGAQGDDDISQLLTETLTAFDCTLGIQNEDEYIPDDFNEDPPVMNDKELRKGIVRVKKWQKEHAQ